MKNTINTILKIAAGIVMLLIAMTLCGPQVF